ncbi:hypothetical protein [Mangrovibacterium marinum]|uniref:Lipoprotein n=1 Tax=Mangrovibacterium marinum TaxID=1639118 RepID=A0A2T5BY58_9BACT|nr:hypothetical protein [Mangrovibacterium marinum]PTN06766.1 hypothetical protein C8N47_12119 [Mangrovibacterium marinum]
MKKNLILCVLFATTMLLLQSCAGPRSITKLLPEQEADKWLYGQALLTDSIYGISYELGFDRLQDDCYLFDFHITNRSNMPLLVDPETFKSQAFDALMNPLTTEAVPAIDPEKMILQYEMDIAHDEAVAKNHLGNVLIGVGAAVAANSIIGTDYKPNKEGLRYAVTEGIMATAVTASDRARFEAQDLNELKQAWENNTIRKTSLETGYAMHGKVFFPATPKAAHIKLFIPVDEQTLEFDFKQVRFPATN